MTQKYKLKVNARQFFSKEYARHIEPMTFWKSVEVPIQLLDEVDLVYVDYGHESVLDSGTKYNSLSGWRKEEADFKFTIKVQEMTSKEYNEVNIHELMDEFQKIANKFFK